MSRTASRKSKDSVASQTQTQSAGHAHSSQRDSPLLPTSNTARSIHLEAVPVQSTSDNTHNTDEKKRFRLASIILVICILSFVLQTEMSKIVQASMGYHKPYFILWVSHSFWALALPAQFIYTTYVSRARPSSSFTLRERIDYFVRIIRQSTSDLRFRRTDFFMCGIPQLSSSTTTLAESVQSSAASISSSSSSSSSVTIYTPREKRILAKYLFWVTFIMTILFMLPSYLWYLCVTLTSMTNLTAIYNTSCFFAYLFSVMLLRERIVLKKVLAVFLSLAGVAVIAITSQSTDESAKQAFPMVGNVLALILAALYGFEEVIYKKYASPTIMPITFANTLTGLMGIVTLFVLWIFIPIFHWIGHEVFEWPTGREFGGVLLVATCGLVYNGCFMIVVSQTSPVFAAVGVMATIPIMTLVDWGIFRESVSWGSIVGGVCILVGFAILVRENHKQALRAS